MTHEHGAFPECRICHKDSAGRGETVCIGCQSRFKDIDLHAANPLLIRRAMVRAGIPVFGMAAAFNRNLSCRRAMLHRRVNLAVALGME